MPTYATKQQVMDAIRNLTPDEWTMLARGARQWVGGAGMDPLDLVNETMARLLEGRRHWPIHVSFGPFVQITMRGVAGNERDRARNAPGSHASWELLEGKPDCGVLARPSVEHALSDAQRANIAREAAAAARERLGADPLAQRAIDAMLAEMEVEEACAEWGMSPSQFEAARKRANRLIKRIIAAWMGTVDRDAARANKGGLDG